MSYGKITMQKKKKLTDIAIMGLSVAVLAVSAWISIPLGSIPVTLQTMAVCLIAGLLGPKKSLLTILVYMLAGFVGLPVFSGFNGGAFVILGPTGGYILGFVFTVLISSLTAKKTESILVLSVFMFLGITACYIMGSIWFYFVYNRESEIDFYKILSMCVIPFIVPDIIKAILAAVLTKRLKRYIK